MFDYSSQKFVGANKLHESNLRGMCQDNSWAEWDSIHRAIIHTYGFNQSGTGVFLVHKRKGIIKRKGKQHEI